MSGPNPKDPEYIKAKLGDMSRVPLDKRLDTIALNSDISVLKRVLDTNKNQPSPEVGQELLGEVEKTRAALESRYRKLNPIADKYGRSRTRRGGRLSTKFCRCIKQVRKTVKARKGSTREQAAIGICVKTVLHSRGKTIKTFSCGKKARLMTQRRKGGCACNWK